MSEHEQSLTTASYYQFIKNIDNDVYVACDKVTTSKQYAIKKFLIEDFDDTDFSLLTHEITICKQLKHRNLLPYLASFVHQDQIWIVSPLCVYSSADRLSKPYGLPELAIAYIVHDVSQALKYLHENGIIHRSVKASHILINGRGRCLLSGLRYSINCITDGRVQTYMQQYPLKAKSNINWFSPEILEQNLFGYTNKSDIYSLGITCCEMANGIVPYSDLQPTEMLLDKLTGDAPRLLDKSCQELDNINPHDMNEEEKKRLQLFKTRQLSTSFHQFTSALCLNFDPKKRPNASKLLQHSFIKQLKKCPASSLLDFLDSLDKQLVYNQSSNEFNQGSKHNQQQAMQSSEQPWT